MSAKKKTDRICIDCGKVSLDTVRVKSWAPGTKVNEWHCLPCHRKQKADEACDDCGLHGLKLKKVTPRSDGAVPLMLCKDCSKDYERPDDDEDETPIPVLKDRSDRLAKLTHKLRVFSSNCEIRAKIALEHSRITKNQTLHTVETSQAAILIQTYETIRHMLDNLDEPKENPDSVTESEPMGECDFCNSPAAYAPGLCSNCAKRFSE